MVCGEHEAIAFRRGSVHTAPPATRPAETLKLHPLSSGSPLRPSAPHANRRVRVVAVALIVVALCGVTELAAFAFYRWIILTRAPFLAYVPVQITPEEFEHY